MRIQNNIAALNTHRQLGANQSRQAKNTEKLSSGFNINCAGDDAAGLSISEKMKTQIRGLARASANAQDAISMIQAAEGALQESTSILQRMRELAIQGANDVLGGDDRLAIKSEIDQLGLELDRIATTTNFNGKYVLSGQYQDADAWNSIPDEIKTLNGVEDPTGLLNTQVGANTLFNDVIRLRFKGVSAADLLNGHDGADTNWVQYDPDFPLETGFIPNPRTGAEIVIDPDTNTPNHNGFVSLLYVIDSVCPFSDDPYKGSGNDNPWAFPEHFTGLELVNSMRAELGAAQNRLEHTIANIGSIRENLVSAESRIRDTDMAKEMMAFTKNNILNQAATAMLAQANQGPQAVLSLLK